MYNLSIPERREVITSSYTRMYGSAYSTDYDDDPIQTSGRLSKVLDELLHSFFENKPHREDDMELLFEEFKLQHFPGLQHDIIEKVESNGNIYNMFGAKKLSAANSVSRTLSTKLGNFWEDIANLSSNVVSPEKEFGIALKGIDVIVEVNGDNIYTQMKTQKNTLTGSQRGRSVEELSVYDSALFVACIDNDASWTYNGPVRRIVGKSFWNLCEISYERLLNNIGALVEEAEALLE